MATDLFSAEPAFLKVEADPVACTVSDDVLGSLKQIVEDIESGEIDAIDIRAVIQRKDSNTVSIGEMSLSSERNYSTIYDFKMADKAEASELVTAIREDGFVSNQSLDSGHVLLVGSVDDEYPVALFEYKK